MKCMNPNMPKLFIAICVVALIGAGCVETKVVPITNVYYGSRLEYKGICWIVKRIWINKYETDITAYVEYGNEKEIEINGDGDFFSQMKPCKE